MESEFQKELAILINKYSKENDSNTPDFILARYLNAVLDNFSAAVNDREQWYGRGPHLSDLPEGSEQIIDLDNTKPIIDYDSTGNPPPNIIDIPRTGDKPDVMPSQTSE